MKIAINLIDLSLATTHDTPLFPSGVPYNTGLTAGHCGPIVPWVRNYGWALTDDVSLFGPALEFRQERLLTAGNFLAALMFLTRKIDWFGTLGQKE